MLYSLEEHPFLASSIGGAQWSDLSLVQRDHKSDLFDLSSFLSCLISAIPELIPQLSQPILRNISISKRLVLVPMHLSVLYKVLASWLWC